MPSRGARVYTRSCDRFELLTTDVGQSAQLSQTLFSDYRAPSLLLTGELDDEGRALKHSPVELREVGNWLAMDLGYGLGGGPVKTVASRVYCFGDLQITGRASGIDADGWQTFDLQIASTAEPATNGDSRAFIEQHVKPHIRNRFEGELTITRRVVRNDDKTAFVADLRSELAGDIYEQAQGGGKLATLRYQETWRHDSIHENQDAAFQAKVVASLKRATDYLRNQLADPNHVEIRRSGDAKSDTRLALGLLAMIKGGVPRDDATVLQSLAELRDRQLTYTSALSHAIMAVEAYQAPETELVELKTGKLELPANRKLEPADAKRVQEWVAQLLKNVDADCDIKETLRFSELGGSGYDNLATSYGLLGLHSASLCGIKVDKSHWRSAANHFVTDQNRGGPLTKLARYDYDRFRTNRPTPALKFPATGWSNRAATETPADSPTWGSATCAGIASLAIAEKGMGERGKTTAVRLASKARHCGLAWLALNMTTRVHPGAISQRTTGIYDYLCALEQAAGLSGLIHISERDWYFEGAMSLMLTQNPDGTWPADHAGKSPIDNTAKAVLFLAHGTMPALRKS